MRAWLITWGNTSGSAEIADEIAAILSPRWSPERVSDLMEQLYALNTSNLAELAAYAKKPETNRYRVTTIDNHADMLVCGHHPWLYGRKVSEFTVVPDSAGFECASWQEPDRYRLKPEGGGVEVAHKGNRSELKRIVQGPLSRESVWDRTTNARKSQLPRASD